MKNVLFSIVIGLSMVSHANAFSGDAAAGKTKAATCAGCHGGNGIGIMGSYPNLAGQHADYIAKQLKAFKSGDRKDPVMAPMAAALSDQDMADLGAYYASFGRDGSAPAGDTAATATDAAPTATPAAPAAPAIVADAAAGKALYEHGDKARGITACVDCHGKEGNSDVLINPNLSNQHPEYIEKQLKAFKNESRHNVAMNQVSGNLSGADIANIGAYFSDTTVELETLTFASRVAVKSVTGDVEAGKVAAAACAACHGADGNALVPMYPSIAGQSEAYLIKQISEFKSGARKDPVMAPMVAALSDEDIKNVSAFFASQTLKPTSGETNAQGGKLYVSGDAKRGITACIACHSIDGNGMDLAGFPGVAGQSATYLQSQLEKFRSGVRNNDKNSMMRNIAIKLSDEDIKSLAAYMSALK